MWEQYVTGTRFESYEDFAANFRVKVPDHFNFGYDVVDAWAEHEPQKIALVWCDDKGASANYTFAEMKRYSDKAANFFRSLGIGKGDRVMLILKRRYEYWFSILALHKLGAIAIPATHLLKKKDIVYRNQAASVKVIVSVAEPDIMAEIDAAQAESPTLRYKLAVGGERDGWISFDRGLKEAAEEFANPAAA